MKHEKIASAVDQVSATFVRTLALCLLIGAVFWGTLIAIAA